MRRIKIFLKNRFLLFPVGSFVCEKWEAYNGKEMKNWIRFEVLFVYAYDHALHLHQYRGH